MPKGLLWFAWPSAPNAPPGVVVDDTAGAGVLSVGFAWSNAPVAGVFVLS